MESMEFSRSKDSVPTETKLVINVRRSDLGREVKIDVPARISDFHTVNGKAELRLKAHRQLDLLLDSHGLAD